MISKRSLIGLLAGLGAVVAGDSRASEDERRPVTPPRLRRDSPRRLTVDEVDDNFEELHRRLLALEARI